MPEITNDARTFAVVEDKRGTFDVQVGGRSGTPTIELPVINGNMVEVTCQFIVKNPGGAFSYELASSSGDTKRLTEGRGKNIAEDAEGWTICVRTDYFVVTLPQGVGRDDATFEVIFGEEPAGNAGQAGAFLLQARIVGSVTIPAGA